MLFNFVAEYAVLMVEYFRVFKTEQRNRVIEKRILGSPVRMTDLKGTVEKASGIQTIVYYFI